MKRLFGSVAAALLLLTLPLPATASHEGECGITGCPPAPTPLPDGYRYTYANGVFYGGTPPREVTKDGSGNPIEVFYVPACTGNSIDENGISTGLMCPGAVLLCRSTRGVMMWIYTRPVGSKMIPVRTGQKCMNPPVMIPLGDVQSAIVRYLRERHLPKPIISTAPPGGRGLVNLTLLFWTQDAAAVHLDITVPLPARLTATPSYAWNFGDGTVGPDDPGTPYQDGVLPGKNPGYYAVTHAYAASGAVTATVTVTWRATFTVPGIDQTFAVPAIVFTAAHPLALFQTRTELVAAGG